MPISKIPKSPAKGNLRAGGADNKNFKHLRNTGNSNGRKPHAAANMNDSEYPAVSPTEATIWRRNPTQFAPAVDAGQEELFSRIDKYCASNYDAGIPLTLCDLAGATGFDSVNQLINHARRRGKRTMKGVSRALLAVSASYEDQVQSGSRGAAAMLSLIPSFDSVEPASQAPERFFESKQDMNLSISGVVRHEIRGQELTGQQSYLKLIQHPTFEDAPVENGDDLIDDAEYRVIELDS